MTRVDKVVVYLTDPDGKKETLAVESGETRYYTFAQALKKARAGRKISQGQLAQMCGFSSPTYVSRIEQGAINPSQKTMQRLMEALGMRLAYVLDAKE